MRVDSIVGEAASRWPYQAALIDQYGVLDYQTLAVQIDDMRRKLLRLGVAEGCGVGLWARNGRGFVVGALAALATGAAIMPIPHQSAEPEVRDLLKQAPVHVLIDDGTAGRLLGPADVELHCGDGVMLRLRFTDLDRKQPFVSVVADAAFVRFTSGTTGTAKGVVITHRGIIERTAAANRGLNLGPEDAVVWVLQMAFHFVVSIVLYLRYGATIVVAADPLADTIVDVANRYHATLLYASPIHYRGLANTDRQTHFSTLQRAISTSTALSELIAGRFLERYGLPVCQAYGIIEVGLPLINLGRALDSPKAVGHPLPDYDVVILDASGAPLGPDQTGELAIRGPGMFAAYLNPAVRVEDVAQQGWFLTGDLAHQAADGLVTIVGRRKAMINVAGNKVFPEEVEAVLDSHPRVLRSRVLGQAHPRMGEVVHAQVELRSDGTPLDPEELISYCRRRLSAYRVPSAIEVVDHIPTTQSDKISRHPLPYCPSARQ